MSDGHGSQPVHKSEHATLESQVSFNWFVTVLDCVVHKPLLLRFPHAAILKLQSAHIPQSSDSYLT